MSGGQSHKIKRAPDQKQYGNHPHPAIHHVHSPASLRWQQLLSGMSASPSSVSVGNMPVPCNAETILKASEDKGTDALKIRKTMAGDKSLAQIFVISCTGAPAFQSFASGPFLA